MKKFYIKNEAACCFVAEACLISKLYHGFKRTSGWITPMFANDPVLKTDRMYGLTINEESGDMYVISADTVCAWLSDDLLEEVATW